MSVVLEFPEAPQFEFLIDLQGQSLYQKWLELGNVGTESDFLNWLKLDGDTLYEPIIGAKGTAFNKNFGTTAGTVMQGNDSRVVNTISGTGTTGYLPKFTSNGVIGNGIIQDFGTYISLANSINIGKDANGIFYNATGAYGHAFYTNSGNDKMLDILSNNKILINNATDSGYTLNVNGSVAGTSAYVNLSDKRYKKNILNLKDSLEKLIKLKGISFDWDKTKTEMNLDDCNHLGFIAQDVELVFPQVVTTGKDNKKTKSVSYSDLIPVIVEAIKELNNKFENLK